MKFAILANSENSFILPMAQGLKRMFDQINIESKIFYNGLDWLTEHFPLRCSISVKLINLIRKSVTYYRLKDFDVIIVVLNLPKCFSKNLKVEMLRKIFSDKPIINYDLHYLLTCGGGNTRLNRKARRWGQRRRILWVGTI